MRPPVTEMALSGHVGDDSALKSHSRCVGDAGATTQASSATFGLLCCVSWATMGSGTAVSQRFPLPGAVTACPSGPVAGEHWKRSAARLTVHPVDDESRESAPTFGGEGGVGVRHFATGPSAAMRRRIVLRVRVVTGALRSVSRKPVTQPPCCGASSRHCRHIQAQGGAVRRVGHGSGRGARLAADARCRKTRSSFGTRSPLGPPPGSR